MNGCGVLLSQDKRTPFFMPWRKGAGEKGKDRRGCVKIALRYHFIIPSAVEEPQKFANTCCEVVEEPQSVANTCWSLRVLKSLPTRVGRSSRVLKVLPTRVGRSSRVLKVLPTRVGRFSSEENGKKQSKNGVEDPSTALRVTK